MHICSAPIPKSLPIFWEEGKKVKIMAITEQ